MHKLNVFFVVLFTVIKLIEKGFEIYRNHLRFPFRGTKISCKFIFQDNHLHFVWVVIEEEKAREGIEEEGEGKEREEEDKVPYHLQIFLNFEGMNLLWKCSPHLVQASNRLSLLGDSNGGNLVILCVGRFHSHVTRICLVPMLGYNGTILRKY